MNQKRLWVVTAIIALIIVVGFVFSVPHTRDIPLEKATEEVEQTIPQVTLQDVFKKGLHTITGSLEVPNACVAVMANATLIGEGIEVAISLSSDEGVCLQVPTIVTFKTTITAPAQVPLSVTVNGVAASTTPS